MPIPEISIKREPIPEEVIIYEDILALGAWEITKMYLQGELDWNSYHYGYEPLIRPPLSPHENTIIVNIEQTGGVSHPDPDLVSGEGSIR